MHARLPVADRSQRDKTHRVCFQNLARFEVWRQQTEVLDRRPTMQLLIFASVFLSAILHIVSGACPQNFDFAGQFCQADVVFKGRPISGVSGVAIDTDGTQLISAAHNFRVNPYFKDNTGRRQRQVQVSRMYSQRDPCDSDFLQSGYSSYLIFARGNSSLSVPACGGVIPWACVPRRTRRTLSTQTCGSTR